MTLAKISTNAKWLAAVALAACLGSMAAAQSTTPALARKPAKDTKAALITAAKGPSSADGGVAPASSADRVASTSRRDPFLPLVSEKKESGGMEHVPPGKAGLVITTVRVDGTVRSGEGMIAVLSNVDQHVYFVREGDRLYDGDVEKIGLDGVTFRQNSKDAFGKMVERVVTKRIYASAGEQQ
jgi:hypothetical protein